MDFSGELNNAFSSLFEVNMGVGKTSEPERILVYSDIIRADEIISESDRNRRVRLVATARKAADYALKTYGNSTYVEFLSTPASGAEPPYELWLATFGNTITDLLASEQLLPRLLAKCASTAEIVRAKEIVLNHKSEVADVIVALSNNSTSHTRYRSLACSAGCRFASLPHFDPDMFFSSMTVDWQALADRTDRLCLAVNSADWIHVTTPNGTDMHICKEGRFAKGDNGLLTEAGSFGNLPAGEAYFAPSEGRSHGTMTLEWGPTSKLNEPLVLTVENGIVTKMEGDASLHQRLSDKFTENENCRNIAELGIGTNDKASRPDNVLEAEKILGTIHIALGDNSGFGGRISAPFHEDYVFYKPTLTGIMTDGSCITIIKDGELMT